MHTICIMMVSLAAIAAPLPEDPAVKVVKKAVEAHGGQEVLLANKGCEMTVKFNLKWAAGDFECLGTMLYSIPDRYMVTLKGELQNQQVVIVQSVIGTKVTATVNGREIKMKPFQEAEMMEANRMQEILMIAPLLDNSKYTLKADNDVKIDDAETAVVIVSAKGMKDMKLFFNKTTKLLVRTQRKTQNDDGGEAVDATSDFSDFLKVDGIMSAMKIISKRNGELYSTQDVTKLKYHEKLDDKHFKHED